MLFSLIIDAIIASAVAFVIANAILFVFGNLFIVNFLSISIEAPLYVKKCLVKHTYEFRHTLFYTNYSRKVCVYTRKERVLFKKRIWYNKYTIIRKEVSYDLVGDFE